MMPRYRPADAVCSPTGSSAPVIERRLSAGDRKQRARCVSAADEPACSMILRYRPFDERTVAVGSCFLETDRIGVDAFPGTSDQIVSMILGV